MIKRIVPDVIGDQEPVTVPSTLSTLDVARLLKEHRIGAIPVIDDDKLVGIVSERDLVSKVVAADKQPNEVLVSDVMTPNPQTVAPDEDVLTALASMQNGRFRHLPVMDGTRLVGIVSIRDVYDAVRSALEEAVLERDAFIATH